MKAIQITTPGVINLIDKEKGEKIFLCLFGF